ncbi:MAG TPA: zf-HC2 domain-containing protein [Actinomycetota bacterium]|nr:zf-HC2 domain-containing protein [Actinomycetota bacterium]
MNVSPELTCAEVEELAPELALGILPGDQRAHVLAHLDGCAGCRRVVKELADAGDALLAMAPEIEPPAGFAQRVTKGMRPGGSGFWLGRRLRWMAATASVAFIVGLAIGLLPGRLSGGGTVAVREAAFLNAGLNGGGEMVSGEVYARSGNPSWVFMTVKGGEASGAYTCMLVLASGQRLAIGSFPMHSGSGSWGRSVNVTVSDIHSVVLLDASGATAATATLG